MSQAGVASNNTSPLSDVELLTGNVGGAVGPDALHNINILGAGAVTVTGVPGTNTLTISLTSPVVFTWSREAGAAVPAVIQHGYINANAGLTTFTLPAVAAFGETIIVCGEGAGGWSVVANAGQNIQVGNISTIAGGSVSSTNRYDCITLVCRVANTTWQILSHEGVFVIV